MSLTLADLKCATLEEKQAWIRAGRYVPKTKLAVVDEFCSDCTLTYRREMEAVNACSRSTGRKRSSTSSGSR